MSSPPSTRVTPGQLGYRRDRALASPCPPASATTRAPAASSPPSPPLPAPPGRPPGLLVVRAAVRRAVGRPGPARRLRPLARARPRRPTGTDFFLEYDTGAEDLPRLAAKLAGYQALAARTGITTPVLFWLPGPRREAAAARPPPRRRAGDLASRWSPPPPPAQAAGGPAGPAWLPAGQPGPRLRLAQLAAAAAARPPQARRCQPPARRHRAGLAPARPRPAARRPGSAPRHGAGKRPTPSRPAAAISAPRPWRTT